MVVTSMHTNSKNQDSNKCIRVKRGWAGWVNNIAIMYVQFILYDAYIAQKLWFSDFKERKFKICIHKIEGSY